MQNTEIKSLTGLRGIAAVAVVFYHFFPDTLKPLPPASAVLDHAYIAVDLFFVLSGFVMCIAYQGRFANGFRIKTFAGFIYARLCRIYPLYIFVTLCVFLIEFRRYTWRDLAINSYLVQAWGFGDSIGKTTWSISTEMFAYLLFPVLCLLTICRTQVALVAAIVAAATLCFVTSRSNIQLHQSIRHGDLDVFGSNTVFPLIRCCAGFLLGVLAYRFARASAFSRVAAYPFATEFVAAIILLLLPFSFTGADVAITILFAPLVALLASTGSSVSEFLSKKPIYWLGLISYSIYLVHRGLYDTLERPLEELLRGQHLPHAYTLAGLTLLPLVFAVATATYYGIEKPARSIGRDLASLRRRPIAEDQAAP